MHVCVCYALCGPDHRVPARTRVLHDRVVLVPENRALIIFWLCTYWRILAEGNNRRRNICLCVRRCRETDVAVVSLDQQGARRALVRKMCEQAAGLPPPCMLQAWATHARSAARASIWHEMPGGSRRRSIKCPPELPYCAARPLTAGCCLSCGHTEYRELRLIGRKIESGPLQTTMCEARMTRRGEGEGPQH